MFVFYLLLFGHFAELSKNEQINENDEVLVQDDVVVSDKSDINKFQSKNKSKISDNIKDTTNSREDGATIKLDCHRAADFIDGKCKCTNGLVGDGIYKCYAPAPQLINLSRKSAPFKKPFRITARILETEYIPISAWCSINDVIMKAEVLSTSEIRCSAPPIVRETTVKISYDAIEWSNEIKLPNKGRFSDAFLIFMKTTIYGLVALVFVLSLYKLRKIYLKIYKNRINELFENFKREQIQSKEKEQKINKTKIPKPPPIIVLKPNIITPAEIPPPPPISDAQNLLLLDE